MLVLQSVLLSVGIEVLGYAKDVVQRYLGHGQTSTPVEVNKYARVRLRGGHVVFVRPGEFFVRPVPCRCLDRTIDGSSERTTKVAYTILDYCASHAPT